MGRRDSTLYIDSSSWVPKQTTTNITNQQNVPSITDKKSTTWGYSIGREWHQINYIMLVEKCHQIYVPCSTCMVLWKVTLFCYTNPLFTQSKCKQLVVWDYHHGKVSSKSLGFFFTLKCDTFKSLVICELILDF